MRKAFIAALMCAGALAACGEKQDNVIVQEAPPSDMTTAEAGMAPTDTAQAPAAGDAATPAADVAAPTDRPVRKAGLWQITSTGQGGSTSTLCVSNATEASPRGNAFATLGGGGFGGRGGPGGPGGPRPGGDGPRGGGEGGARGPGGGEGGPGGGGPRAGGGGFGGGGGFAACTPKIARAGEAWTATTSCTREMGEMTMKTSGKMTLTGDLATSYKITGSRTVSGGPREGVTQINVTGTYKGACPAGMQPGDLKGENGTRNVLQGRGPGGGGGRQG